MKTKIKLPPRQARGLSLVYDDGDLFVSSFGYSASLSCASFEGELSWDGSSCRDEKQLSLAQQSIVNEWADLEDEYLAQNGWKTWAEIHDIPAQECRS